MANKEQGKGKDKDKKKKKKQEKPKLPKKQHFALAVRNVKQIIPQIFIDLGDVSWYEVRTYF